MALSNFLNKAGLAAAQVIQGFEHESFKATLESHTIGIAFGANGATTLEGKTALEFTVNQLSRLYPKLVFNFPLRFKGFANKLRRTAIGINEQIEISFNSDHADIWIIAGKCKFKTDSDRIFMGASGWNSKISRNEQQLFGQSNNPFGAAGAACFTSTNVFKHVFSEFLSADILDVSLYFSMKDFSVINEASFAEDLADVTLANPVIAGLGAIGNSLVWTLSRLEKISGNVSIVDHEEIELSNLQRYVLSEQKHQINSSLKIDVVNEALSGFSNLKVHGKDPMKFSQYVSESKPKIDLLITCMDNIEDRIKAQAALPKSILNAWTQPGDLGVSRHFDFIDAPCLSCIYLPKRKRENYSDVVARSLGLESLEAQHKLVRKLLHSGAPVGIQVIQLISSSKSIPMEKMKGFEELPMDKLYSTVACGGSFIEYFENDEKRAFEVPLVFQSALAGVMLASEVVQYYLNENRNGVPTTTRVNIMDKVSGHNPVSQVRIKKGDKGCFCGDSFFKAEYEARWNS